MSPSNFGSSSFGNLTLASCETKGVLFEILNKFNIPGGVSLKHQSIFLIIFEFQSLCLGMSSSSFTESF